MILILIQELKLQVQELNIQELKLQAQELKIQELKVRRINL
jgi:hypothetical protein